MEELENFNFFIEKFLKNNECDSKLINEILISCEEIFINICKYAYNGNSGDILFIDASKEFKAGKKQNELTDENVNKIVKAYAERKDIDKYAHIASMEEIEKNEYNCNIPRYVDTSEVEEEIDISAVKAELADIMAKKQNAIDKVNSTMKLLGL